MKASEAVAMVAALVAEFGLEPVRTELKAIRDGKPKPKIETDVNEAVYRLSGPDGKDGGLEEFESILSALPAPAAPSKPSPRATKAEVEALVSAVLERAKALGSAFSSTELAAQLSKPAGKVSHALHLLVKRDQLRVEGTKRAARYSVVAST